MTFDKQSFRDMDDLICKMLNIPDTLYILGLGMCNLHGKDCAEGQALFYMSDCLNADIHKLLDLMCEGASKGDAQETATMEVAEVS